jgi:[ribosomal protein S5]-alanine N-acetyltransferase
MYPVELSGERVKVRDFVASDLQSIFEYASDEETARFMTFTAATSPQDSRPFLEAAMAFAKADPRAQYDMGIELDGVIVGGCSLRVDHRRSYEAEMGYVLKRELWGRGLMSEVVNLLFDFGFGELDLHRISAFHDPDNAASRRVMEKAGMQYEGVLRENLRNNRGEWRDSELRSILVTDRRS